MYLPSGDHESGGPGGWAARAWNAPRPFRQATIVVSVCIDEPNVVARGRFTFVIRLVANDKCVEMFFSCFFVGAFVGRDVRDRFAVRTPRELRNAFRCIRNGDGIAAAKVHHVDLLVRIVAAAAAR